jgi:flavin-dependent dehydrogenase
MRAALVIGADGLRSIVARRLGLARQSRWPRRVALVAHFRDVAGMGSLGEMHVTAHGYVGLAQVNDGLTNVALVVPASRARAMAGDAPGFLSAWLAAHPLLAPRFAGATRETPVRATGPFASRARRAWAPGAMLTGDAADFYDPFTGEGIYAALRGGELLAPFAAEAVQTRRSTARRHALAAYERARHTTFGGKWCVERLIGMAVASPLLLNHAARVLSRDRDLADLLIGVTGDFVPPSAVLSPRTLLRFLS